MSSATTSSSRLSVPMRSMMALSRIVAATHRTASPSRALPNQGKRSRKKFTEPDETRDIQLKMILNRQRTVRVARPPLEAFLARVREQLRLNGSEITVCLVTDKSIAHMNETFRRKKGPTDVLSFPSENSVRRTAASRHAPRPKKI